MNNCGGDDGKRHIYNEKDILFRFNLFSFRIFITAVKYFLLSLLITAIGALMKVNENYAAIVNFDNYICIYVSLVEHEGMLHI